MSAEFIDRDSGEPRSRVDADVLVGCDGIHSVVRRALFPNQGPPKWNGVTMWRAVTEHAPFLSGRTVVMIGASGRQMVVYPISRRHNSRPSLGVEQLSRRRDTNLFAVKSA